MFSNLNSEIVIQPKSTSVIDFKEILNFRELFYIFTWRDIKVRYKQTILGILWVIFQPLTTTVIFTVFFGNLAKIPSGDLPYPLFVLTGLVFWNFFSNAVTAATNSMIDNEGIIKKVYFPKLILPLSSIITASFDFAINLLILFIIAAAFGFYPKIAVLILFPFSMIVTAVSAAGTGFLLSALNVKYRDVRYILPFFIQILIFLTPVIYPLSIVQENQKLVMALNPMTGAIETARTVFAAGQTPDPLVMAISAISAVLILILGTYYFSKTERFFADIV